ncbi:hypothetical protein L3X38_019228 [Prunus dulcis]|uniref:Uncharacterized protein n=1 Tax=Prunus dulcis TaxID=3755 RepID=A0AAD4ZBU9_PRUDU|nr:hypothetical protein L3X38_019228 [Prunus dulcis]
MTPQHLVEFGWGLANTETKEKGPIAGWSPQEVLNHPWVRGFLTPNGWNSTIESVAAGMPMFSWPFFAEQQKNCWYTCNGMETGMEIDNNMKKDKVEKLVRELMEGEKGEKMKNKAKEWKTLAGEATGSQGSSFKNLDNVVNHVLLRKS